MNRSKGIKSVISIKAKDSESPKQNIVKQSLINN